MRTKIAVLGCLALVGAGVWYFFIKDKKEQEWKEEEQEPVGPIQGHVEKEIFEPANNHLREVMHAAKELAS
jgi:hypothetical protein